MLDIKQFSSDLIDSYLDILTVDEKLLAFKEIKIIFTRYDFDQLFPVGMYSDKIQLSFFTTTNLVFQSSFSISFPTDINES
jgi:hypothetical protein